MSKRAILYARVSTDEQAETGYGLPGQLIECRKYAEQMHFEIVKEFKEDYTGKMSLADRPEGKELMAMVKSHQADAVIAHRVDRIARDSFFARLAVRNWLEYGLEVHTCDIGRIEDDNSIVFTIMNWQGHADYKKIIENTTRGRRTKAQEGKVVGCNRAPYGYRFIRDAKNKIMGIEIYESEAGIVKLVFKWYVYGDESGKPLPQLGIARKLEAMGIPTPGACVYNSRGSRGIWSYSTIATIIKNETYAGTWWYGSRSGALRKRLPKEKQIPVSVPSIVDRGTWERAQAQRALNKKYSIRNAKNEYLLRGMIKCGCGRCMYGLASGRGLHRQYRCSGAPYIKRDCQSKYVRADYLEPQTWEGLKGFFADLDRLWDGLQAAQEREDGDQEPMRAELETTEDFIEESEKEIDEIAVALRKAKGKVGESLQRQQDEANARYERYIKRRDELMAALGARVLTDERIAGIMEYARDVREGIENATFEDKRRHLETIEMQVTVKDGRYFAKCILGEWEDEIRRPDSGIDNVTS